VLGPRPIGIKLRIAELEMSLHRIEGNTPFRMGRCFCQSAKNEGDIKNARWLIDEVTGPVAAHIYNMYVRENPSYLNIAAQLNAEGIPGPRGGRWVISMVGRVLKDPKYKGEAYNRMVQWAYVDGKKVPSVHPNPSPVAEGVVPAIVSVELWEAAQARRSVAKVEAKRRNKEPHRALLRAGYIHCGYCGSSMCVLNVHHKKGTVSTTYRCNSRKILHKVACEHHPYMGAVGFDEIV
jgi:hypothetical protein